jgi:3-methyl-2-oxobutanoate hydroxymethyltransferase
LEAAGNPVRTSPDALRSRKGVEPLVCLTAYTAPIAELLDPHVDVLLVGDSLGMVIYGHPNTQSVTLETMIAHAAAVVRGSRTACVVVDLPKGSFEESPGQAFDSADRLLRDTGAQGVKIEGGVDLAPTLRHLVEHGVPVMGHVGLLPQSISHRDGFRVQGKDAESRERILRDAEAVADAGAFALVVESTVEPLARAITDAVPVPTIGIGASPACDGQVLVTDDLVGLFQGFTPRYVRRYAEVGDLIARAAAAYAEDVRARRFPGPEHCFRIPEPSKAPPSRS